MRRPPLPGRRLSPAARQIAATVVLAALAIAAGVAAALLPEWVPPALILLALLLGVFALRVPGIVVVGTVAVLTGAALSAFQAPGFEPGMILVLMAATGIAVGFVRSRDLLGLQGSAGDLMIVDLRDRLSAHGRIPPLPDGWRVDTELRPAFGDAFSGDFVVADRRGDVLEIAVVDVSGKGQGAGVRSLQLSGALGGLLGSMPPGQFLAAANDYLLRQDWTEGFATAVHLAVDLASGHYTLSTAGHPPALHLHAGSGQIVVLDTVGGPALGIIAEPQLRTVEGTIDPGDAVVLYTDGMVESAGDLDVGIDRLMGQVERVVATRRGGSAAVMAAVRPQETDDRALVLVRRS